MARRKRGRARKSWTLLFGNAKHPSRLSVGKYPNIIDWDLIHFFMIIVKIWTRILCSLEKCKSVLANATDLLVNPMKPWHFSNFLFAESGIAIEILRFRTNTTKERSDARNSRTSHLNGSIWFEMPLNNSESAWERPEMGPIATTIIHSLTQRIEIRSTTPIVPLQCNYSCYSWYSINGNRLL